MTIYEKMYKKLAKIIDLDLLLKEEYLKYKSNIAMDLNINLLFRNKYSIRISLAHNYIQNGDLMCDPDMEIIIYPESKMVEALTYQDCFGYRRVYDKKGRVLPKTKNQLNTFLNQWLSNILQQNFELYKENKILRNCPKCRQLLDIKEFMTPEAKICRSCQMQSINKLAGEVNVC